MAIFSHFCRIEKAHIAAISLTGLGGVGTLLSILEKLARWHTMQNHDIERTTSERFCGDYFPFGMLTVGLPGSTIRIRFKTDDTLTSTGFFLKMGVYEPKPQQFVYPRQTDDMTFLVRQEALREQKADFAQGIGH